MSELSELLLKQQIENERRDARIFIENARNAMHAVRIALEEGDSDEAIRLIDEALE